MFYYDPVCGKKVNRQKVQAAVKHEGETYYLCCPVCQSLFERDPGFYIRNFPHRGRRNATTENHQEVVGPPLG